MLKRRRGIEILDDENVDPKVMIRSIFLGVSFGPQRGEVGPIGLPCLHSIGDLHAMRPSDLHVVIKNPLELLRVWGGSGR